MDFGDTIFFFTNSEELGNAQHNSRLTSSLVRLMMCFCISPHQGCTLGTFQEPGKHQQPLSWPRAGPCGPLLE